MAKKKTPGKDRTKNGPTPKQKKNVKRARGLIDKNTIILFF